MITEARMEELEKEGFDYITCLTHRKIEELVKEKESPFYPELFDEALKAKESQNYLSRIETHPEFGYSADKKFYLMH